MGCDATNGEPPDAQFRPTTKEVYMKYSFKIQTTAVLALAAALLSFSTMSYASDLKGSIVVHQDAVKAIKRAIAANRSAPTSASLVGLDDHQIDSPGIGTPTPPVDRLNVACSYSGGLGQPLVTTFSATYLGYTFYSGSYTPSPGGTPPYNICGEVKTDSCNFLLYDIGVPYGLQYFFTGNIRNDSGVCGQ